MESFSLKNKQRLAKLPNQIDVSNIVQSTIMFNNSKKYSLLSYANSRESIFIQSPLFDGLIDSDRYKEYVEHYFKIPKTEEGDNFLNMITNIEQRLMSLSYDNRSNWFGNLENIKFRSLIKTLEDSENSKVIKFRMPYNIKTKRLFVDSLDNLNTADSELISINDIGDGFIRLIININAIWFADDTFGLYLRPVYVEEIKQCEYQFQEQNTNSFFIDSEMIPQPIIKKPLNVDVNKLNNMVTNVKHELEQGQVNVQINKKTSISSDKQKRIGRRLQNDNSSESFEKEKLVINKSKENILAESDESDSNIEIEFEDSD